eukprot:6932829-Prymnesium_polylepis.1
MRHRGRCKVADVAEVDYEVEAILDERRLDETDETVETVEMLIKWKGWPREDSTWEPLSALSGCPGVLSAWRSRALSCELSDV